MALWEAETARQGRELDQLTDQLGQQERTHAATHEQRVALEVQVANNQVAQQIRDLNRDISDLTKAKTEKEKDLRGYNTLARQLGLVESPDLGTFAANREQALTLQRELRQHKQQLEQQKLDNYVKHRELEQQHAAVQAEVDQLASSKGKITGRPAGIRPRLCPPRRSR